MHSDGQPFYSFILLVTFDQSLRQLQKKIEDTRNAILEVSEQQSVIKIDLERAKERYHVAHHAVDSADLELQELNDRVKLIRKKIDSVETGRAYQALVRELDQIGGQQNEVEEALLGAMNQLEIAEQEYARKKKTVNEKLANLEIQKKDAESQLGILEQEFFDKSKQRAEYEGEVPKEWLDKYVHMRMNVSDPVVPVKNGSCNACFHTVTVADRMQMERRALKQCKACFRLLYLPEVMDHVDG